MRAPLFMLGCWIATLGTGCGLLTRPFEDSPEKEAIGTFAAMNSVRVIDAAELDELTRAFADRYVGLLSSTCDALKRDNADLVQRREAQVLLADCATNVYDIASNPDAYTRMLDLVVVTTLVSQVWIDDNRVAEVFADRQEVLVRALHHGRSEAWALAAQVLRPEQLDLLDYLLWDWRRNNTDMVRASFVRFSTFSIGRGRSAGATLASSNPFSVVDVLGIGDLFSSVGRTGQAVDEARLFSERMFYLLKRGPTLLRWQAEAIQDAMLASPEVGTTIADLHRLTNLAEDLPEAFASERRAILAAFDDGIDRTDTTLANIKEVLKSARELISSTGPTIESLNQMLGTADTLATHMKGPEGQVQTQPSRTFDIREYIQAVKELGITAEAVDHLIESSGDLLGSSDWEDRIKQANDSADGRIMVASAQGQLLMTEFFRKLHVVLVAICALLAFCVLVCLVLYFRPPRTVTGHAGASRQGRHPNAVPEAATGSKARGQSERQPI